MKSLAVGFGIVVALGFGIHFFLLREMTRDQGRDVLAAFGVPENDEIWINLSVTIGTLMRDPPRLGPNDRPLIREWIAEHYILRDESGAVIPFEKQGSSGILSESRATMSSEFYLAAKLKQGKPYTLDYIPVLAKGHRYRHGFVVPSEETEPEHLHFDAVKED